MNRRVVITGIGVVAPGGIGTDAFWQRILSGRSATRTITAFDPAGFRSRMAAECDFDPQAHGLTPQEIRRMDRTAQFAVVSTEECAADAGLDFTALNPGRVGVTVGSAVGATIRLESEYVVLSDGGRHWNVDHAYAVPHLYDYLVPSSLAAEVAWRVGAEGPVSVVSDGCTAGIDAIGYAAQLIRSGEADVMITGGTEAPIAPITVACFDAIKATSVHNDDPEHAHRPYDVSRNGFVLGEGCAMLVLEEYGHARRRGARIYAEIGGVATRANAFHMTGLQADGREMAEAIRVALGQARIEPSLVDWVSMHGTGTKQNDKHETAAIKRSLGDHAYRTPASSIKSMIGHSLGAVGALETAACALAITRGAIPPTANLHDQDPELDLDYVPLEAREHKVDVALNVGSGFGGFQSAMVLCPARAGPAVTAVVTGLGVIAPNGAGIIDYWTSTLAGISGIGPVTRFDASMYPVTLAGEVDGLDPAAHLPRRLIPQTDRMTQLALIATEWALDDAGLVADDARDFEFGVVTSASAGGFEFGQRELQKLWTQGPSTVSAYMSFSWFYAVNTGQISIRHKLRGPAAALVTDQAGGLDAVGLSRRLVADGTPVVITAGVDGALCPMGLVGQIPAGYLSTSDDPARAYRPFDADATGAVTGEGGAVLIVEDGETARNRGARVYGEIAGYAATFDPPPGSGREGGLGRAAVAALRQAGLLPEEVDVVFADAAGTVAGDRAEADVLEKLFGPRGVPVTAPKTMTGRLGAGAGALDVATALLAMRDGIIPPTVGSGGVGYGHQIDLVTAPRRANLRTALVLARGIGGFNAAVALRGTGQRTTEEEVDEG